MKRSGTADLPLHGGRVPAWLAARMTALGTAITESVIHHHGRSALLSRLSDPFWFQALGAVMGMDWHSSGITTSVIGALKRGLNPRAHELGLHLCGGRGRHSRNTPQELRAVAERRGLDGDALVRISRLTARVDNNAIGDGFQIYLHGFFVAEDGEWAVVQQGLNPASRLARRYHWHSPAVRDFTSEPHTAIVGQPGGPIQNLVDQRAVPAQDALLTIARTDPERTLQEARRLVMPAHHNVQPYNVDLKRLGAVLAVAHDRELRDFASLLLVEQLGPRTLQSLALIAEVVHGAPSRFTDPARFAFAHGGKDGHPVPVPLTTYDDSLGVLRRALGAARLDDTDRIDGLKRLDRFVRAVEAQRAPEAHFDDVIRHERAISRSLKGRTVFDDKKHTTERRSRPMQKTLFTALLCAAAAATSLSAHVMVSPLQSTAGAQQKYELRVHNEAKAAATSVDLDVPEGVTVATIAQPTAGTYTTTKAGDRITRITWTVDVQPGKYVALPFTAKNPDAGELHWSMHEHLSDGSVVDWSDKPGSKQKGSVTKLAAKNP